MERNEISIHEAKIYAALKTSGDWLTNAQITEVAKVAPRTVRSHTLRFVKLGILDVAEVFPAHRYRLAEKASKRNTGYIQRLEFARSVFGV